MNPNGNVCIVVEDVAEPPLVVATIAAIRRAFASAEVDGEWVVALVASDTRGRWDIGARGPGVQHVVSFTATVAEVPALAERYALRALLPSPTKPAKPRMVVMPHAPAP